ncbi:MAG: LuxR family transcriptional regulator [Alphaproteobacteria bacterium]|nr:LuxR family transcriptional regulator [Alphaproteobacteria bacterium]
MDQAVLHFIESAARASDVAQLNESFLHTMRGYGIGLFAAAVLDPLRLRPEHFLASNYPSHWIEHYTDRGYDKVDPVVLRSLSADQAFVWTEPQAPRPARQLFDEAAEAGIVSGFAVPITLRNGRHSVVSVTSDLGGSEFERLMKSAGRAVQTAIYCYHDTLCDLAGIGGHRPSPIPKLEAEVLRWLAAGNSTQAIGEILCMPECAVERHVVNALERLNLTSRDHLAAEAWRRGYLSA